MHPRLGMSCDRAALGLTDCCLPARRVVEDIERRIDNGQTAAAPD